MASGSIALQGEMSSVASVGHRLSQLDQLNGAVAQLSAGMLQVQAAGNAAALTSLVSACRPVEAHAQSIASARMSAGGALAAYAGEVSELQREARRLLASKSNAESRKRSSLAAVDGVDQDAPDASRQMQKLTAQSTNASAELQQIERALVECDQARLRADRRCAEILSAQTNSLQSIRKSVSGSGDNVSLASLVAVAVRSSQQSELEVAIAQLSAEGLTPEEAAEFWSSLGLTRSDVKNLPIADLFKLANVDGVPAWARDIASQAALKYSISHPDKAYDLMGFSGSDLSRDDFVTQTLALKEALDKAKTDRLNLPGEPKVQMVGFGNHDGAITTAISFGDLDKASNVAVNAPGIGSTVDGIGNALGGAQELFKTADMKNPDASYAIVTWYGYHTPGKPPGDGDVWNLNRADAGAPKLANFVDGIYASRGGDVDHMTLLAHSYGSTMAVQALKLINHEVDALVTYGSAGVENGTVLDDLNVKDGGVYATGAKGDNIAWAGYQGDKTLNPVDIKGVTEFSSEDGDHRVTAHDMFTEDTSGSFWNWGGKVGYLTAGTSSLDFMGSVIAGAVN